MNHYSPHHWNPIQQVLAGLFLVAVAVKGFGPPVFLEMAKPLIEGACFGLFSFVGVAAVIVGAMRMLRRGKDADQ